MLQEQMHLSCCSYELHAMYY